MFDTLLIITLIFFHSLPILTDLFKFRSPPPFILTPLFIKFNKNLQPPLPFILNPPFIRHLRVSCQHFLCMLKAGQPKMAKLYMTFNCSKPTMETPKQSVESVQSEQ